MTARNMVSFDFICFSLRFDRLLPGFTWRFSGQPLICYESTAVGKLQRYSAWWEALIRQQFGSKLLVLVCGVSGCRKVSAVTASTCDLGCGTKTVWPVFTVLLNVESLGILITRPPERGPRNAESALRLCSKRSRPSP